MPGVAERIEMRPTAALVPYARNARTHSAAQVRQIAASIREFGFTNPVLIDEVGGIIAGHGRVLAALQLDLAEVPTITLGYLTEPQRRAYRIADNQLAFNAGWDSELLRLELGDLATMFGFDLSLIGFDQSQLGDLLSGQKWSPQSEFTGEMEWYTPPAIIEPARSVLGAIDLDPASSLVAQRTVKAKRYYTRDSDGLSKKWRGRVWLNPPYAAALIDQFIGKLCDHVAAGDVSAAIMLTDDKTDTRWFHHAAVGAQRICFPSTRISFVRPAGRSTAWPPRPLNGSAIFYFGSAVDRFDEVFGKIGLLVVERVMAASPNTLEAA